MQNAREVIASIVNKHCKNVKIVGFADGVQSGVKLIKQQDPDLILLDINMQDGTGFDLLNKCKPFGFKIIFISAYEEYAIKAFKFSAIDYVLKPIESNELISAIQTAINTLSEKNVVSGIDVLEANYINHKKEFKKIILKTIDSIYSVSVKDIVRCESDVNYTRFFLNDGRKILLSKPLKEYDELLSEFGFFRIHQSHLINLDYFEQIKKLNGGFAVMKDGSEIPISSRKKELFLQTIYEL